MAEVNTAIRAFMSARRGRPLFREERAEYERLLGLWSAAVRRDAARTA